MSAVSDQGLNLAAAAPPRSRTLGDLLYGDEEEDAEIPESRSCCQRHWRKLLMAALLIVAILVGVVIFALMNKTAAAKTTTTTTALQTTTSTPTTSTPTSTPTKSTTTTTAYGCITGDGAGCKACVAQSERTSATTCSSCNPGYFLLGDHTCQAFGCTTGIGGSCSSCVAQDERTSNTTCATCNTGYALQADSTCKATTPYVLGQTGDTCSTTCDNIKRSCDESRIPTTQSAITSAFKEVGVTCASFANDTSYGAREQPAGSGHCVYNTNVYSECGDTGEESGNRRLCYCLVPETPYVIGKTGDTCTTTCGNFGRTCDQSSIPTTQSEIQSAFEKVGVVCSDFASDTSYGAREQPADSGHCVYNQNVYSECGDTGEESGNKRLCYCQASVAQAENGSNEHTLPTRAPLTNPVQLFV